MAGRTNPRKSCLRQLPRCPGSLEEGWYAPQRGLQRRKRSGCDDCLVSVLVNGGGLSAKAGLRTNHLSLELERPPAESPRPSDCGRIQSGATGLVQKAGFERELGRVWRRV